MDFKFQDESNDHGLFLNNETSASENKEKYIQLKEEVQFLLDHMVNAQSSLSALMCVAETDEEENLTNLGEVLMQVTNLLQNF